jgi:four helix bundle protein
VREWIVKLENRTQRFATRGLALCELLPRTPSLFEVSRQLAAAAGGVAANHRAARRARSTRELASKLQIVSEEVDECVLWLELLDGKHPGHQAIISALLAEAKELRAIFGRSLATTRKRLREE